MRQIWFWIRIFLFATAFTPLVIIPFTLFPFVFSKTIFLWSIAALIVIFSVLYFFLKIQRTGWQIQWKREIFNPIFVTLLIFILSSAVSTFLAPNAYRGFFGDIERGDGLLGLLVYLVIFLGALFFFESRDWNTYFRLGLLVGFFVIIHVVMRYFGFEFLPIGSTRQPGSFLGNPAFVASFIILFFGYAAIVYENGTGFWKYFSLILGLAGVGVLGFLGIRGALVGLGAGFLVFLLGSVFKKSARRPAAVIILVILILTSIVFSLTRDNSLWKSIPLFDRLSTFSLESASIQTRIISFGVSWEAFKERPIFGWGLENYNVAYNKHYNPAYAVYAEDWFDRAHNKILDVLVMQGVVGIISYLGIFIALFYAIWEIEEFRRIRLFLGAVMIAYFVQNLFIFDHISSYLPFFIILSFCAFCYERSRSKIKEAEKFVLVPKFGRILIVAGMAVLVIFSFYSLYIWNIIPFSQAKSYAQTFKEEPTPEKILAKTKSFLEPYNFYQKDMRMHFLQTVFTSEVLKSGSSQSLFMKGLNALKEVALKEPYDPKVMILISETYNELSKDNPEFFAKSVEYIKKAQELSPKRQAIRGVNALILSGVGKHEQAIQLVRETVALEPKAAKSHYYLGMILALSLKDEETKREEFENFKKEALAELDIALNYARELAEREDYGLFAESDFQNIIIAYSNLRERRNVLETSRIAREFFPNNLYYYKVWLVESIKFRDVGEVVNAAREIKRLNPSQTDSVNIIIDLAEKGNWEVLEGL